jgi:hypothetical protein
MTLTEKLLLALVIIQSADSLFFWGVELKHYLHERRD